MGILRPAAVNDVVLILQHRVDKLAVLTGKKLLPDLHVRRIGTDHRIGGRALADGNAHCPVHIVKHRFGFGNAYPAVGIFNVKIHRDIVFIAYRRGVGAESVASLNEFPEIRQIVLFGRHRGHGTDHPVHYVIRIHLVRVPVGEVGTVLSAAGHKLEHGGHIHLLPVDGERIFRQRILLNLVDKAVDAV